MNIRKSVLTLSVISAIGVYSGTATAEDKLWYAGISINSADLDDVNTSSTAPVAGVTRTIDLIGDSDEGFGIKFGRTVFQSSNGNKIDVEVSYSNSEHSAENIRFLGNDFLASEGRSEGSFDVDTTLIRATYQFNLGAIKPYLGFGIGQTSFDVDGRYGGSVGTAAGSQPPFANGDDDATAIQYRLGAEYSINDQFGLFLEYTATDVDDIRFSRTGGGPGGLATTTQEGDFDIDSVNFGVNFRF